MTGLATKPRVPGLYAHLGPLQDPDLFLRPDPELEAMMDERYDAHTSGRASG